VDAKSDVQAVRNELRTAGYALANLRSGYQWKLAERASMRLDAGIDNLGNRQYDLPLGGRYWVGDKTGNTSVPGMGRRRSNSEWGIVRLRASLPAGPAFISKLIYTEVDGTKGGPVDGRHPETTS